MKDLGVLCVGVYLLAGTVAPLLAHEETFLGTVAAVAASSVRVNVVDAKTKTETPQEFVVGPRTKVYRGDAVVSFTEARIQKDERIAVTIDHDAAAHAATVIKLAARR